MSDQERTSVSDAELSQMKQLFPDPHTHISVSDGGAHTKLVTLASWPVECLAAWVRDREAISLEQARHKMSALPAWIADFKDRGTLRVGSWADIMMYQLDELGYLYDRPVYAHDFPGGERRMI